MDLNFAIVSDDVPALRHFYEKLLRISPVGDDDYCEFSTGSWTIAIVTAASIDFAAPGAHAARSNRSVRLELSVDDVDAEFARLRSEASEIVCPPTDWPWGTRATWLRDPDGNLVSLYQPTVTAS